MKRILVALASAAVLSVVPVVAEELAASGTHLVTPDVAQAACWKRAPARADLARSRPPRSPEGAAGEAVGVTEARVAARCDLSDAEPGRGGPRGGHPIRSRRRALTNASGSDRRGRGRHRVDRHPGLAPAAPSRTRPHPLEGRLAGSTGCTGLGEPFSPFGPSFGVLPPASRPQKVRGPRPSANVFRPASL